MEFSSVLCFIIICIIVSSCFMKEIVLMRYPGEKLGISIRGGVKGHAGNPQDETDEGIFISKVIILKEH